MGSLNTEVPVLNTYQAVVSAYSDFLTVAIHTILYERNIYPQASFIKARKYNLPVRQSRHPKVCKWIQDAVAAVEAEMLKVRMSRHTASSAFFMSLFQHMLRRVAGDGISHISRTKYIHNLLRSILSFKHQNLFLHMSSLLHHPQHLPFQLLTHHPLNTQCTVSSTSLIIHSPPPTSTPLERYVFSTASFPQMPASEISTPFTAVSTSTSSLAAAAAANDHNNSAPNPDPPTDPIPPTSDLPEQFRATLSRLTTSLSRLSPLPTPDSSTCNNSSGATSSTKSKPDSGYCSFTLAIQLRDEDPAPIGREEDKHWIPAEPGWQQRSDPTSTSTSTSTLR